MTYLGCVLEETMSEESMVNKVVSKVNVRLKFLHRENKYLIPNLRHLLCNALIQPHFDYACSAWYPNLSISQKEFETINWLPIKERYQCINSIAFKYFENQCPHYLIGVFMKAPESSSSLRDS